MTSLYDTVTGGAKELGFNLRAGEMKKFGKLLTPEQREHATSDGIALHKRGDRKTDNHANFVGLSRTRTKYHDAIEDLEQVIKGLNSQGCRDLLTRMKGCPPGEMDALREEVSLYAKLAMASCAHVFWFTNVLENYYAREDRTEEQLQDARDRCKALHVKYDESKSKTKW